MFTSSNRIKVRLFLLKSRVVCINDGLLQETCNSIITAVRVNFPLDKKFKFRKGKVPRR
jgi:hypothetical protein